LRDFGQSLKLQALEVSSRAYTHDAVGAGGGFVGEFAVAAAALGATINQVRKRLGCVGAPLKDFVTTQAMSSSLRIGALFRDIRLGESFELNQHRKRVFSRSQRCRVFRLQWLGLVSDRSRGQQAIPCPHSVVLGTAE
jgi:hypothetical protein